MQENNFILENLSILYFSCFSYKNLWNAFLQNKQKYLGNHIKMYFCIDENKDNMIFNKEHNTEIITYNERSSYKSTGNFLKRLLYSLNNINTEYIIYYCDDMFITDYVNIDKISKILVTLMNNNNIKIVKLSNKSQPYTGEEFTENDIIYNKANKNIDDYIMNLQPTIIKKDFLIDLVNECINNTKYNYLQENSKLEAIGTEFIRSFGDEVICLKTKEDIIPIVDELGVLSAGILYNHIREWLKLENLYIKTYENNFIYKNTKEEFDYIGELTFEQLKTIHNINIIDFNE